MIKENSWVTTPDGIGRVVIISGDIIGVKINNQGPIKYYSKSVIS